VQQYWKIETSHSLDQNTGVIGGFEQVDNHTLFAVSGQENFRSLRALIPDFDPRHE
jgi:hypothetical protein